MSKAIVLSILLLLTPSLVGCGKDKAQPPKDGVNTELPEGESDEGGVETAPPPPTD